MPGARSAVKRHDLAGQKGRARERLKRQKELRQNAALKARRLVAAHDERSAEETAGGGGRARGRGGGRGTQGGLGAEKETHARAAPDDESDMQAEPKGPRRRPPVDLYQTELMVPEWLVAPPDDLACNWTVQPRPAGRRCLVICSRGTTTARARNGARILRWSSALPGGGGGHHSNAHFSILDCIFQENPAEEPAAESAMPTQFGGHGGGRGRGRGRRGKGRGARRGVHGTFFVIDCMCWNGHAMYDCDAEFRLCVSTCQ